MAAVHCCWSVRRYAPNDLPSVDLTEADSWNAEVASVCRTDAVCSRGRVFSHAELCQLQPQANKIPASDPSARGSPDRWQGANNRLATFALRPESTNGSRGTRRSAQDTHGVRSLHDGATPTTRWG